MKDFKYYMEAVKLNKDRLKEASSFANLHHAGQTRKFDGKPYSIHPTRVAKIIKDFKGKSKNIDDLMIAAFLHETLEDTKATPEEISNKFGELVLSLVQELTSDTEKIKEKGKSKYLADKMTKELTSYGLVLKLADRLDNVSDFPKAPSKFVTKYKKETEDILKQLKEERVLTDTQSRLVTAIEKKLSKF